MDLELRNISKGFGQSRVLEDISFRVGQRELVSIIGPSGVGKTTLLKIIAGLERPDGGTITFSHEVSASNPVILVFQDYVLFPSMTVSENVAFGLKARRLKRRVVRERVERMLGYFHLTEQADHYPAQLSAGQQQRTAIARAMVVNPAVLLLDEPFANLDRNLKMETARFIRETQRSFGIPTISVTHDLEEAFAMSDTIGILLQSRLKQFDTPKRIYFAPSSYEVARFLGPVNTIPRPLFPSFGLNGEHPDREHIFARPENLTLQPDAEGPGLIRDVTFAGHYIIYTIELAGKAFTVYSQNETWAPGQRVRIRLAKAGASEQAASFPAEGS